MLTGGRCDRRAFLARACAAAAAVPLLPVAADAAAALPPALGVHVHPRRDWAQGLAPTGPLPPERPEDVRFLLVHHTASSNRYTPDDVPRQIRSFHRFHTSAEKGWPDVAYNFFVDRYGGVWEGRAGSLAGPVQADATGGSQGFAQLCCFIGDHGAEPPTPEAVTAMTRLLAALAATYGIDTSPGATVSFVSRGSNRWPRGTPVTATTIAGHRDMSQTTCPGDAAYRLVREVFPTQVTAVRSAAPASTTVTPPTATVPTAVALPAPAPTAAVDGVPPMPVAAPPNPPPSIAPLALTGGGLLLVGAAGWAGWALRRRGRSDAAAPVRPSSVPTISSTWRIVEAPAPGEDPTPSATTFHLVAEHLLVAGVVAGDRDAAARAVGALHDRVREVDNALAHRDRDAVGLAELLLEQLHTAVRTPGDDGGAAGGADHGASDAVLATVLPGAVAVAASDASQAALLTGDGAVYRPRRGRTQAAGGPATLSYVAHDVAAVALRSAVPVRPADAAQQAALLGDLCRALGAGTSVRHALDTYRHTVFGATGVETVAVGLVRRDARGTADAAPTPAPRDAGGRHV